MLTYAISRNADGGIKGWKKLGIVERRNLYCDIWRWSCQSYNFCLEHGACGGH
jgi:hypothetical protein